MLNVALLCARRAPGLDYLLYQDDALGRDYQITVGLTTDPASDALPLLRDAGIPALVHEIRGRSRLRDRGAFDARTVELLAPYRPDLLVLSGYLHIVTAPLLASYPQRIINVHDGDLPQYPGLHATRDALRAGESSTRCTVHLVTKDVDAGTVLARSIPFPVQGRHHYVQREWMMQAAWGPLIGHAIRVITTTDPEAAPRGQPTKPAAVAVGV